MKRTTLLGLILLSVSLNVMAADQCQTGSSADAAKVSKDSKDDGAKKDQFGTSKE
jgi:hypothetical protein